MTDWTNRAHCTWCGPDQALKVLNGRISCPVCAASGRQGSVGVEALNSEWRKRLLSLSFDRFALLSAAKAVNGEGSADQQELEAALRDLKLLGPEDSLVLFEVLVEQASWDGSRLQIRWRPPFNLFAESTIRVGEDCPPAELSGPLAELVTAVRDLRATERARKRLRELGPGNILTVPEAVAELRMSREEGREWLSAKGLIHYPGRKRRGAGRVIVSELLGALRTTNEPPKPSRRAPTRLPMKKTERF